MHADMHASKRVECQSMMQCVDMLLAAVKVTRTLTPKRLAHASQSAKPSTLQRVAEHITNSACIGQEGVQTGQHRDRMTTQLP